MSENTNDILKEIEAALYDLLWSANMHNHLPHFPSNINLDAGNKAIGKLRELIKQGK